MVDWKGKPLSSFSTQTDSLTRPILLQNSTMPPWKRYTPRRKKDVWLSRPEHSWVHSEQTCTAVLLCICPQGNRNERYYLRENQMVQKWVNYTVAANAIMPNQKRKYQEQMLLFKCDKNIQLYKVYLGLFIASIGLGAWMICSWNLGFNSDSSFFSVVLTSGLTGSGGFSLSCLPFVQPCWWEVFIHWELAYHLLHMPWQKYYFSILY